MKKLLLFAACSFSLVFAEDIDVVCCPATIINSVITRQEYDVDMLEINFGVKDEFDCPVPSPQPETPDNEMCPVPSPQPETTEKN